MNFWQHDLSEWKFYEWEHLADDWVFALAILIFVGEIIRLLFKKQMTWNTAGDCVANFVTLLAHLGIVLLVASAYLAVFYWVYPESSITQLPNNFWTLGICIVLADLAYYWEHRMAHTLGFGWATHTVHHSSPYFNISVAYRHGPLDAVFGLPFLLPLVFLGFDPFMVLFSAAVVQLFQTLLHTELVYKFPRFIEAIMNTPSHHRVHHGSNPQYIDKNYAGILIIWDKMFGTFAEEQEKVVFGIATPLDSVNPFNVFFHGFARLGAKMSAANGLGEKLLCLWMPPGWVAPSVQAKQQGNTGNNSNIEERSDV